MRSFIVGDLFQFVIERVWKASGDELGLGVVCEAFAVEFVFEMLERESLVKNDDVSYAGGGLTFDERAGSTKGRKDSKNEDVLHYE